MPFDSPRGGSIFISKVISCMLDHNKVLGEASNLRARVEKDVAKYVGRPRTQQDDFRTTMAPIIPRPARDYLSPACVGLGVKTSNVSIEREQGIDLKNNDAAGHQYLDSWSIVRAGISYPHRIRADTRMRLARRD